MKIVKNGYWENASVRVTIITPTFNRRNTLDRAIRSIEAQTYMEWEYIIVDDGSCDDTYQLVKPFMENTNHPVMYIKKENGGVHTARNLGFRYARGELIINLDSDDELTPNAVQTFLDAWDAIPSGQKKFYREVVAQCVDENGKRVGKMFPPDINSMPKDAARRCCDEIHGEHVACMVTSVMQSHLFPEPAGVTFVTEDILWNRLDAEYLSYYTNDIARVYHMEGDDHLSEFTPRKKTIQSCRNTMWEAMTMLNSWDIYGNRKSRSYFRSILIYCVMEQVLRQADRDGHPYRKDWRLTRIKDRCIRILLWIPASVAACIYRAKKL